jgi:hypothetical protein
MLRLIHIGKNGIDCALQEQNSVPWWQRSTPYWLPRMGAGHVRWPHADINLVWDPIGLNHLRAVIETAGLALHDEKPERVSRLFDKTIAGCSFGSGRGWACGKCRQRGLKPPSKPPERRRPLLGDFVLEGCAPRTKRIRRHRRAPGMACRPTLIYCRQASVQVETFPRVAAIFCHGFRSCRAARRRRSQPPTERLLYHPTQPTLEQRRGGIGRHCCRLKRTAAVGSRGTLRRRVSSVRFSSLDRHSGPGLSKPAVGNDVVLAVEVHRHPFH